MSQMTPREIVEELDKHIIGQKAAKRAVAIALRNRWRRQQLGEAMRLVAPLTRRSMRPGSMHAILAEWTTDGAGNPEKTGSRAHARRAAPCEPGRRELPPDWKS